MVIRRRKPILVTVLIIASMVVISQGAGASGVTSVANSFVSENALPTGSSVSPAAAWHIVPTLTLTQQRSYLNSVAVTRGSYTTAWAVGYYFGANGVPQTLIEHTNGLFWRIVPSPNSGSNRNYLNSVTSNSSSDAWAVGFYWDANNVQRTLTEHWDGSQWTIVPSPNNGVHENYLDGVVAISSDDVWAVGLYSPDTFAYQTLIEHWDGSSWTVVSSPNAGNHENYLYSVTASGPNNLWAVGYYSDLGGTQQTLLEKWDGTQWSIVSTPNVGGNRNYFNSVTAISPTDIWAVGFYWDANNVQRTLTEHWDGSQWTIVDSPNNGVHENYLNSVTAVSSNDVWAVGLYSPDMAAYQTLTMHWNGTQWTIVDSPNRGSHENYLNGVAAIAHNNIWAVGYWSNSDTTQKTLIERYLGLSATQ